MIFPLSPTQFFTESLGSGGFFAMQDCFSKSGHFLSIQELLFFVKCSVQKNIQQILHSVGIMQACHKTRMQFLYRIQRCINGAPTRQQRAISAERFIEVFFCVQCLFTGRAVRWRRLHTVRDNQPKISCQLFHRLTQRPLKKFCGEVNHITIRTTAKTVKPGIHLHAGIAVCMKWAADHAAMVWLKSVGLRSLSGRDILFYQLKKIVLVEDVPPLQFHAMTALFRFCTVLLSLCKCFLPLLQFLQGRWTSFFFDFLQSGLFDFRL